MVNAGRILIMARGLWSNLVNYEMLDLVTQDGVAYLARQASVGVSPKTDESYTYWQPFGSATLPDGTTIIYDSNNKFAVNIDGRTIVYDSTSDYLKVSVDNDTLKYDSTNGYLYADISFDISDLDHVVITSPVQGQILQYNGTNWVNVTLDMGKILTDTLAVGATTLTFTDAAIGNNSLIDIYTDPYGVVPTSATQSGTTVTLTFDPQDTAVSVKIVIKNS